MENPELAFESGGLVDRKRRAASDFGDEFYIMIGFFEQRADFVRERGLANAVSTNQSKFDRARSCGRHDGLVTQMLVEKTSKLARRKCDADCGRGESRYNVAIMRAVIQRVSRARVTVEGRVTGEIGKGIVVLLGVGREDAGASAAYLAEKTANLRIFADDEGKMNRSLVDAGGAALVVSQFTLYGDTRGGRRPGFSRAAGPDEANRLYEEFVAAMRGLGVKVETGIFQTHMDVELVNDGPVTILMDSEKTF